MHTSKTSLSREKILGKIREGLSKTSLPMPFPEVDKKSIDEAFSPIHSSIEEQFAAEFIKLGGKFIFCENEQELLDNIHALHDNFGWKQLLCADEHILTLCQNNKLNFVSSADPTIEHAEAAITGCEALVARTGSTLLSSKQNFGRTTSVFYPVHIIVAYANQLVQDIPQALKLIDHKYGSSIPSMINLNTGPSRTADIEKTLVVGVHGPGEVFCLFVNA